MKLIVALIAIIAAVSANPTPSIEESLIKLHKFIDAKENKGDGDGKLSKKEFVDYFSSFDDENPKDGLQQDELKKALEKAGVPELFDALWREFNNNGDDKITDAELESDFEEFDTNDDGELCEKEFVEAIVLGMIFHDIDSHEKADGNVTEAEFTGFFLKAAGKDKHLEEEELIKALEKYPVEVVKKLFTELDDNNNKKVDKAELKKNFNAFNDNNDDHLTVEEFRNAVSNGVIGQIFKKLDQDDNGKLTADEIMTVLDHNKNGEITLREVENVFKGIPTDHSKKFFGKLDKDTNHKVTKAEVTTFVETADTSVPKDGVSWLEFKAALAA